MYLSICETTTTVTLEHFYHPEKKLHMFKLSLSHSSNHQPHHRQLLLHFVFIDNLVLDISYEQSHIICDLLLLVCFTWFNVFKVHPHYIVNVSALFSILWLNNTLLCEYTTFCMFICQWTLGLFLPFDYYK